MSTGTYKGILKSFGFQSYLWTQFLGAFNDNLYKMVVSLFAVDAAINSGGGGMYLSIAGSLFILPFLLFSGAMKNHFGSIDFIMNWNIKCNGFCIDEFL